MNLGIRAFSAGPCQKTGPTKSMLQEQKPSLQTTMGWLDAYKEGASQSGGDVDPGRCCRSSGLVTTVDEGLGSL